ncbi:DNA polymerase delta subunit 3 [Entomortierella parvispora]|uniref:DNA polymerase delta subunit 3 n=1 Tax=Entomortierella parvispora TaxID=205924 RepID=A0A9P3H4R3_9FUNG|nr:DNA polymerase delta subunit 3 [Entomortierella parvispora]
MIPRITSRVATHPSLLLRPFSRITSPFPHRPLFFSTTARKCNASTPPSETAPASSGTDGTAEQEQVPTDLDSHPDSISCTVCPPSTYAFLKPTPVVLLTGPFGGNWCYRDTWQATLADQGYQSTSIEFTMPEEKFETGDGYIRHFVKVLKKSIETDHSFFPPILIAHGLHALVAQRYVESNPVSALVLVSPFIPEVIPGRFQKLSQKLLSKHTVKADSATTIAEGATETKAKSTTDESEASAGEKQEASHSSDKAAEAPLATENAEEVSQVTGAEIHFDIHADVVAQEGFREAYVLPAKAVYKIDRVAKELQEKEKEKELKEKEILYTKEEEADKIKETAETMKDSTSNLRSESSETNVFVNGEETLGKDSVPDGAVKYSPEEAFPVQTVESEASIPSPLERLPMSIYNSIPPSVFEPLFPILLVTSNADEIVSTADVKEHHNLAGQVDHIELEDLDDGGHLIMVSDNAEWEQGIQGITAWLDSNGMMSTEIENQTLELLVATVEDEKKIVTYRWLSRSMGYSVNVAKQLMESYLTSVGQGKAHGTYYVARQEKETGGRIISLVSQDNIQDAKKDPGFIGCHIYSLEPSKLVDRAVLSAVNAEATQLQQGKDINVYRIVQNHDIIISKSNTRAAPPTKPAAAAAPGKPVASETGVLGAKPGMGSSSSLAASSPSTATHSKAKPAPASKASVSSFFGKSATKTTPASSSSNNNSNSPSVSSKPATTAPKTSTLNFKPVQKRKAASDDEDDVDSEEERDRRLALSSRLDQDLGDIHESIEPKKAVSTADVDAIKKKQRSARRLAVDDDDEAEEPATVRKSAKTDSDDEDEALNTMTKEARIAHDKEKEAQRQALENMMLVDGEPTVEDEDSQMIDVEAVDPPKAPAALAPTTYDEIRVREDGVRVRRVRGTRIVTKRKTSKNERGYLVTEDVLVQEAFSEDEVIPDEKARTVPAPAPPVRVAVAEAPKPTAGAKKKAGSGNQSLLNFFSKK